MFGLFLHFCQTLIKPHFPLKVSTCKPPPYPTPARIEYLVQNFYHGSVDHGSINKRSSTACFPQSTARASLPNLRLHHHPSSGQRSHRTSSPITIETLPLRHPQSFRQWSHATCANTRDRRSFQGGPPTAPLAERPAKHQRDM